jgi:hypothetical protein
VFIRVPKKAYEIELITPNTQALEVVEPDRLKQEANEITSPNDITSLNEITSPNDITSLNEITSPNDITRFNKCNFSFSLCLVKK